MHTVVNTTDTMYLRSGDVSCLFTRPYLQAVTPLTKAYCSC